MELRLLGEIRLKRAGQTVALPASKRTRALLGYLAATAAPQPRQALCDLLWDGPDDPRAALRWSLTKLRPLVNDARYESLTATREHIAFSPDGVAVDVIRLDALSRSGVQNASLEAIEAAALSMQGEFLDGLDLPSCYRFHHWCLAERERWASLRIAILGQAIARLADAPERALSYARSLVSADPLSEAAHGRLVALLTTVGRRKEAQEHYDYARAMLGRELGVTPGSELKPPPALRRPASEPRARPAAPIPSLSDGALAEAPTALIGRDKERDAIMGALGALRDGEVRAGLLFLGEPGLGKSRLLEFAAQRAARKGARVVAARCFEAETVRPYGCWADILGPLIAERADASMRRDLGAFLPSGETREGDEGGRTRLFSAVLALLTAAAQVRPVVLMIDDLQWIDEASASLLHFVLRSWGKSAPLLFVGAVRVDEIDENPWCKRVLGALAQDSSVARHLLAPFGVEEAAQLLGGAADVADVAMALKASGGNPLYLAELANARRHGRNVAGRDLDVLIGERIARLDESERSLVRFASATAQDFRPEWLGAAMEMPEAKLIDALDRLERRGLLKSHGDERFDFAHDLVRQATYRGMSQANRRLIHRRIALSLEATAETDRALAGEVAYHAGAAGEYGLAVKASIAAGEHCLQVFANTAAADAADRGLAYLQHLAIGPDRAHWHIGLLKVKVFSGASPGIRVKPKVAQELKAAVEAAELLGVRQDDATFGWHMMSWSMQQENNMLGASQAILRAEEMSRPIDPLARCQQLASTGRCLLEVEFEVPRARAFLADAERLASELNQSVVELDWGLGLIARWDGDLKRAQTSMQRALTLARLHQDRWREMECLVWMGKIAIESEKFDEVGALCDEIDAVARRIGDGPAPVAGVLRGVANMVATGVGMGAQLRGDLAALRLLDDKAQLGYLLNQIAGCLVRRGEFDLARETASEALQAAKAVSRETEIAVAKGILALLDSRGDAPTTVDRYDAASEPDRSARARFAKDRLKEFLPIPTPIQTATP